MTAKYKAGDIAFIVESNRFVREVEILRFDGGFYTVRFTDLENSGLRIRESRLF